MKITRIWAVACLFAALSPLHGLTIDRATIKNQKTFGIEFPDTTSYYGKADGVIAISRQQYIVGPLIVNEITIDMVGTSTQVRIYHAQPHNSKSIDIAASKIPEKLKPYAEGAQRMRDSLKTQTDQLDDAIAGMSAPKVSKDYPTTTHAHTIEFVIEDLNEFEVFYDTIIADYIDKARKYQSPKVEDSEAGAGLAGKIYKISAKK